MKNKKMILSVGAIFIVLIVLNVIIILPKSYTSTYMVGEYEVQEAYDIEKKEYKFTINSDGVPYEVVLMNKKVHGKNLVDKIDEKQDGDSKCMFFQSDRINLYPVCYKNGKYVDLAFSDLDDIREKPTDAMKNFQNIRINSDTTKKLLIWAQKGYYLVDKNGLQSIMFLENESYFNSLSYQIGEYVLTPNYDEDYTFSKFYLINIRSGKLTEWKFDYNINFNSYYLGQKNGILYLFDRKERTEYAIDPRKKTIEIVSKNGEGKVWSGDWENISTLKLANNDYIFESEDVFSYTFSEEGFKRVHEGIGDFLISNSKKASVVYSAMNDVYYLVDNKLYNYNPILGEVLLAEYSEWEFNNKNSIFIY